MVYGAFVTTEVYLTKTFVGTALVVWERLAGGGYKTEAAGFFDPHLLFFLAYSSASFFFLAFSAFLSL